MRTVLTASEMKQSDYNTINYYGIKSSTLMERASLCVCEELDKYITKNNNILVFVGIGNNGGDGACVARILHNLGYNVAVILCGKRDKFSVDLIEQINILEKYNIPEIDIEDISNYDVFVDAIFGIGLSRDITGSYADYINAYNDVDGFKLAIDIPSGINTDNGQVMNVACKVDVTVTFNFLKPGHLLYPGREYAGNTFVYDIGINSNSFLNTVRPSLATWEKSDVGVFNIRNVDSNKGDYGKVLIIAGSKGMCGAAVLSAKAALRTGAGLVKIYTSSDNRVIIQSQLPEAIVSTYDHFDEKAIIKELEWSTTCVMGPGMGTEDISKRIVETVIRRYNKSLVIDADGLNIISNNPNILSLSNADIIVTPHLGEMSRLIDSSISDIKSDLINVARTFAEKYNVITCVKCASTVTAIPNGNTFINDSGNDGMATAGSGDVLTGIIIGLIANGIDVRYAAAIGSYIHGLSGDIAFDKLGAHSLMASDIIDSVSDVMKEGFR